MSTEKSKIGAALDLADETFRASEDSWLKLQGVLAIFLLRYMSDLWHDTHERAKEQFGSDEAWIQRKMKRVRFLMPPGNDIDSLVSGARYSSVSAATDAVFQHIAKENSENMKDVFNSLIFDSEAFGKTRERDQRLKRLLVDLSGRSWSTQLLHGNDVGSAALNLIDRFFETSLSHGGNHTPSAVSELVAKLLDPQPGMRIYDPFLGTGSLLVAMAKQVKDRDGHPSRNFALYGQEVNRDAWVTAKLNMFLNSLDDARIAFGDTLKKPAHLENNNLMLFERVGSSLPFTATVVTSEEARRDVFQRFGYGFPAKGKSEWAYMLHIVSAIAPGGMGVVVVPQGALFRGRQEKKIRERLVAKNLVDAVIELPPRLFFGRTTPMAILVFRKNRKSKNILFVDASREFLAGKAQNSLRSEDIEKIVGVCREREFMPQYSRLVPVDDVKQEQCNLSVARYVNRKALFEDESEIISRNEEMEQLEDALQEVRVEIKSKLAELAIYGLDDINLTKATDGALLYVSPMIAAANRLAYRLRKLLHEAGEDNAVTLSHHRRLDAIVDAYRQEKIGGEEYLQRVLAIKGDVEAYCYGTFPASVRYGEDTRTLFGILSSMLLEADQDPVEANLEELVHRVVDVLQRSAVRDWSSAINHIKETQGKLEDILRVDQGQLRRSVRWDLLVEQCIEAGKDYYHL
ncbi:N-6 DNA methylase [Chryseolinea lacunae]|uniref:site-specific DNA-methyltransferase (adenine-specific) n=1 Tax=Chryseolinea lacunae TaxID=2801331 RepID=A0ABS1KYU1_9BACT|nr:N-6 DNA methylase [Chryseolinea lacunae]MBL0744343.1 N-6 DNA methylase [Chryseolinea lacunae]